MSPTDSLWCTDGVHASYMLSFKGTDHSVSSQSISDPGHKLLGITPCWKYLWKLAFYSLPSDPEWTKSETGFESRCAAPNSPPELIQFHLIPSITAHIHFFGDHKDFSGIRRNRLQRKWSTPNMRLGSGAENMDHLSGWIHWIVGEILLQFGQFTKVFIPMILCSATP